MKVAISTDGAYVSAHFGRCPSYTIVEIESGKLINKNILGNPGHSPGFLPAFLHEKGASCIICGGMGRRAQALFAEKGIDTIVGVTGEIDDVIDKLLNNELKSGESLCEHEL